MADFEFNTIPGQTIARELMIAYLNVGTNTLPLWSAVGKRVEDSTAEYDWGEETKQDILGNTWGTMKKPVITQTFDPCELDSADEGQKKIWNLAVVEQDAQALSNQDMLIAHWYTDAQESLVGSFAERYESCMVKPSSLGGAGGGNIGMPLDVTYGGKRTVGTVSKGAGGAVTFTPATSAAMEE